MSCTFEDVASQFLDHRAAYISVVKCKVMLSKYPRVVDYRDAWGWTPLMHAAAFGNIEVMKELINNGANVNAVSYPGPDVLNDCPKEMTALMAIVGAGGSRLRIVKGVDMLLENGADPKIRNARGQTVEDICLYWMDHRNDIYLSEKDVKCYRRIIKNVTSTMEEERT